MVIMSDNDVNEKEETNQSFEETDLYKRQMALQAREFGRKLRKGKDPVFRTW